VFDGYAGSRAPTDSYQNIRPWSRATAEYHHRGSQRWGALGGRRRVFEAPLAYGCLWKRHAGAQDRLLQDKNWFWRAPKPRLAICRLKHSQRNQGTESNYTNFIPDCPPNLQRIARRPVVTASGQVCSTDAETRRAAPCRNSCPNRGPVDPGVATRPGGDAPLRLTATTTQSRRKQYDAQQ